jgi:hypothetical protein
VVVPVFKSASDSPRLGLDALTGPASGRAGDVARGSASTQAAGVTAGLRWASRFRLGVGFGLRLRVRVRLSVRVRLRVGVWLRVGDCGRESNGQSGQEQAHDCVLHYCKFNFVWNVFCKFDAQNYGT